MNCVTNVTTSMLWNGEALEEFSPGRGLRQGDPLSPFLFVLHMERLSALINTKAEEGTWKGIKVSNNSPSLTHLFFANDLILFFQVNFLTCNTMINVQCLMFLRSFLPCLVKPLASTNLSSSYPLMFQEVEPEDLVL